MFSSNQKFCVSCTEQQLEGVITLALNMYLEHYRNPTLAYQFTTDGKFAIGWCGKEPKPGWTKFPFDRPSNDMLVAMVKQFIAEHPCTDRKDFGDGSVYSGYLIEVIETSFADEWKGVKNSSYGIISICAYNCFYSK